MDKADDIEQRLDQAFQMKLVSRIAEAEGVTYSQALEMCFDGVNWPRYAIAYRLASPAWTMLRRMHPNDWHDAFKRNYPELTRWELECLETDYAYDNPEANVKMKWAIEERKARKERKNGKQRLDNLYKNADGLHTGARRRLAPHCSLGSPDYRRGARLFFDASAESRV